MFEAWVIIEVMLTSLALAGVTVGAWALYVLMTRR